MNDKEIIESGLADMYAMGLASAEEKLLVEQAMADSALLRAEIESIRDAMGAFGGAAATPVAPGDALKEKILADFKATTPESVEPQTVVPRTVEPFIAPPPVVEHPALRYRFYRNVAAAAGIALILSGVLHVTQYRQSRQLENDLAQTNAQLQAQANSATQMKHDLEVLYNQNSQPVSLSGTPSFPNAAARVFWVKNTGDVYVDLDLLPTPPSGKQYQLWAIVNGQPQDAGVLPKDKLPYRMQKMKSFGQVDAFAITLEKDGGSPTPNLDQLYVIGQL